MIRILVDMNLSPDWIAALKSAGWSAVHWSMVGAPGATDTEIMAWARENKHVVFTHDLDFGAILAATRAEGPSVIQIRSQDVLPETMVKTVTDTLRKFEGDLLQGALISIEPSRSKVRVLPLGD